MKNEEELLSNLILSVLSQMKTPKYGYALVQSLEEKGVAAEANTLYPLLRRLEKQGLLISKWDTEEAKPRKYYQRTSLGDRIYLELRQHWNDISINMDKLLGEDQL